MVKFSFRDKSALARTLMDSTWRLTNAKDKVVYFLQFEDHGVLSYSTQDFEIPDEKSNWAVIGEKVFFSIDKKTVFYEGFLENGKVVGYTTSKAKIKFEAAIISEPLVFSSSTKPIDKFNKPIDKLLNGGKWTIKQSIDSSLAMLEFETDGILLAFNGSGRLLDGSHSWTVNSNRLVIRLNCGYAQLDGCFEDLIVVGTGKNLAGDSWEFSIVKGCIKGIDISETSVSKLGGSEEDSTSKEKAILVGKSTIWLTRATQIELEAKLGKSEFYDIPGRPPRKVRDRLVYHIDQRCAYALKDYEVYGELKAYNSGVVLGDYDGLLALCKCCGEGFWNPCTRCGGSGFMPEYKHVQAGVCFKCGGDGRQPNRSSMTPN